MTRDRLAGGPHSLVRGVGAHLGSTSGAGLVDVPRPPLNRRDATQECTWGLTALRTGGSMVVT